MSGARLHTAYRLLLALGGAAVLVALSWGAFGQGLGVLLRPGSPGAPGGTEGGSQGLALAVLLLVATASATLTINYPGRSDVVLLPLPLALSWWALGAPAATLLAGIAALLGNALRRRPPLAVAAGAGRLTLATAGALALAERLFPPAGPQPALSTQLAASMGVFFVTFSLLDAVLDGLDDRLAPGGGWGAGLARTDPLTNLALLPLALFLAGVGERLGRESLLVLLGGLVAVLWIVRATVNQRTLHGALQRLHREVAAEREQLATLFEQSGEGIYTVDAGLRISSLNPAMAALLGRPAAAIEGQPCAAACHFLDPAGQPLCPVRCPLRRAEQEGRPVTEEVLYRLPAASGPEPGPAPEQAPDAGQKHLLLTYTTAGEPGRPFRLGIGIARDITAQKEAERLRADFVSLVTHELRSPLTISTGYVNMLRRTLQRGARPEGPEVERVWRYLDRIEGAEQHLLRLVNSLLEMARLERPDLPVEYGEVAIDQLLEDAVEATAPTATERGLRLEQDIPAGLPRLWSSELYLQEIVTNLLSNAVKYTPPGGRITVGASVTAGPRCAAPLAGPFLVGAPLQGEAEGGLLRLFVADTGYGLSAEEQAQLFTRFFRSQRPEVRREPGTGLGLAFTRQMVERIGGTIAVQSEAGAGSTFTVTLPLRPFPDGGAEPRL
ncbi:MAG TPA: PAS domain-containing sensor histidine kinase [Chloroflexota bacterium]|nr:PAS domain-containing sensor histidine kinase [Chloroflexota bacterium]